MNTALPYYKIMEIIRTRTYERKIVKLLSSMEMLSIENEIMEFPEK